jgi:hypothetical protein
VAQLNCRKAMSAAPNDQKFIGGLLFGNYEDAQYKLPVAATAFRITFCLYAQSRREP